MADKVALITGGARRIGAEITIQLHAAGYTTVIHYQTSQQHADSLVEILNQHRAASACALSADLSDQSAVATLAQTVLDKYGRIDLLVNNASVYEPGSFDAITTDNWQQTIDINLRAPVLLAQSLISPLRQHRGCVINLLDVYSERPLKNYLTYSISKAALMMATRGMALELAPEVRVNGISPGSILWPEDAAEMSPLEQSEMLKHIPLGKLGNKEDIAASVLYLAEAQYITGQIITVDGGRSLIQP